MMHSAEQPNLISTPSTDPGNADFEREVAEFLDGLNKPLPEIAPRYFYDTVGSELFEAITRTVEYYPTRTETAILRANADSILQTLPCREIAELGSGAGEKIRLLLDAGQRLGTLERCVMLDISRAPLDASIRALKTDYPALAVRGVVGDFSRDLGTLGSGGRRLILFLAGTIGNFARPAATNFLRRLGDMMAESDGVLLGVDLVKDKAEIDLAYNDSQGVTAAFNRNILKVVNRRFQTDFDPDQWRHVAFYDPKFQRIEMRLRAKTNLVVRLPNNQLLPFSAGDEIRTELSCKYTPQTLDEALVGTGLTRVASWTDPKVRFGLFMLRPTQSVTA